MGSRKPSAKARRVAEFKAQLGGGSGGWSALDLDDAFGREAQRRDKRAAEHEAALEKKMCTSKKRYPHRADAEEAIQLCALHGRRGLHCYECPYCGGWHLTSKPERP